MDFLEHHAHQSRSSALDGVLDRHMQVPTRVLSSRFERSRFEVLGAPSPEL